MPDYAFHHQNHFKSFKRKILKCAHWCKLCLTNCEGFVQAKVKHGAMPVTVGELEFKSFWSRASSARMENSKFLTIVISMLIRAPIIVRITRLDTIQLASYLCHTENCRWHWISNTLVFIPLISLAYFDLLIFLFDIFHYFSHCFFFFLKKA